MKICSSTRCTKKLSKLFLFLLLATPCLAQKQGQSLIDSLIYALPTIKNDTLKARAYKRISEEYFFIDTDKALYYSKLGLNYTIKMPWKRGIGVFSSAVGRAYSDKGMYDSCQLYYQRALEIYRQIDDKWNMASTYNNLGAAEYNIVSNQLKAIEYYFKALKITESIEDNYLMAITYGNISGIYLAQKNYQKALLYAQKSLEIAKRQQDTPTANINREVANALVKVGVIYNKQQVYTKARKYFTDAISLLEKEGDLEGLANAYDELATTYQNDIEKRIYYASKAFDLWQKINPMHSEAIANAGNVGNAYFEKARQQELNKELLQQAEKYYQIAVERSRRKGEIENESYWRSNLAELQAQRGDYKNAYYNFRSYQAAQDSLYSQESKNKIAAIESQKEIELRDNKLKINQLELDSQKKQRMGLWIGIGLLVIIGGLLYWQNQTRKRTNTTLLHLNQELDEANKIKAKFFAILSHDLRSPIANLISFLNLQKQAPDLLTPEQANTHQQRISTAAESLLDTMESMLLWSKSQMEHFKPHKKEVAVSELFQYVENFFASSTNIPISFDYDSSLMVVTDEDYLKVIMQNLTSNALKALNNKTDGRIEWRAYQQQEGQVILSITDNAGGMSAQQLDILQSANASLSGTKSGLGLHLIRDLTKAIDCQVSVNSTDSMGTEFKLVFG